MKLKGKLPLYISKTDLRAQHQWILIMYILALSGTKEKVWQSIDLDELKSNVEKSYIKHKLF